MSGNVREWVEDCWHHSYDDDGTRPEDGGAWTDSCDFDERVSRGGSFRYWSEHLRVSARVSYPPAAARAYGGCRCLRPPP